MHINEQGHPQYDNNAEFLAVSKESILDGLATDSVEDQCSFLYSYVQVSSKQWYDHKYSLPDLKDDIIHTWWHFLTVGMSTASALDHQRLVHLLACIKQTGYLAPNDTPELPETEKNQGRLWVDLPFFQPTVSDTWEATLKGERKRVAYHGLQEWRNLNFLAARLSVSQVHDLRHLAVWALRDALEVEDPAAVTEVTMEVVSMWLSTYGFWLEEMAAYSLVIRPYYKSPGPAETLTHHRKIVSVAPGSLAKKAGVEDNDVGVQRWRFWRSRLQALATGTTAISQGAASAVIYMAEL